MSVETFISYRAENFPGETLRRFEKFLFAIKNFRSKDTKGVTCFSGIFLVSQYQNRRMGKNLCFRNILASKTF